MIGCQSSDLRSVTAFEEFEIRVNTAEMICVWRTFRPELECKAGVIILAPGFCRKMSHFSGLALYLGNAGFDVYRYDPLNHIGLSTGAMENFNMTSGLESMAHVVDWIVDKRRGDQVGLIATSLSARIAYRLISSKVGVEYLISAVGVVDLRATLLRVFGEDLVGYGDSGRPQFSYFENRRIDTRQFGRDGDNNDWFSLDTTTKEISEATIPIVAFCATEDNWARAEEVRQAMRFARHPSSQILSLMGSGHELGVNPSITRVFYNEVTEASLRLATKRDGAERNNEPGFRDLLQQAIFERRRHRSRSKEMPV